MMTTRWNSGSNILYQAFVHRRISHDHLEGPLAVYRYNEQLLCLFDWNKDVLLSGEPGPLPSPRVLDMGFQLCSAIAHLHAYGVVLARIEPGNVLVAPNGDTRLFDLEIDTLSDSPIRRNDDPVRSPMRDVRALASMLQRYVAVEDHNLRDFLKNARRGAFSTPDDFASGIVAYAQRRPAASSAPLTIAAAQTDTGVVRELNEDDMAWRTLGDKAQLFVVADGMGGHDGGDVASNLAIRTFCRTLRRKHDAATANNSVITPTLIEEAFESANDAVIKIAEQSRANMGTTLTALFLSATGRGLSGIIGHAGDSRVYLLRGGRLQQLTEDHSMVAAMVAAGKIKPEEARTHPKANVLLNFLGANPDLEPDVEEIQTRSGDRFILCSDGLWGEVADVDIEHAARLDLDPRRTVQRLLRLANDAGGRDNVTVIVVDIP